MSRNLVSFVTISSVLPIPGADRIELIKMEENFWQCVSKKGEFNIGDRAVYFEIDSGLPIDDKRFEFFPDSSIKRLENETKVYRLRTIRLRKTLSQGLVLPLSLFDELAGDLGEKSLSDILNVQLWEPPQKGNPGEPKGNFPNFIRKSDQERIQNLPDFFYAYKNTEFEVTEKLNGSSLTVYYCDGVMSVCSRNLDLKEEAGGHFWDTALKYNIKEGLNILKKNIGIQGEIVGPKIQKNPYGLEWKKLFIYNIFDIDEQKYMGKQDRLKTIGELIVACDKEVLSVPEIYTGKILDDYNTIDDLINFADGKSALDSSVNREGIVCKSLCGYVSFKVISNNYLLGEFIL